MTMNKHVAYNLETGEVLTTNHSNHLKRWVARVNRWNVAHGYSAGRWVFVHSADWYHVLSAKLGLR